MGATLRLYAAVAAGGFRRFATYRVATAAGVFTNTVFGFVISYTYIALWHERPALGGYGQAEALTFVWVGQGLLSATAMVGGGFHEELQERIRTGDIAIDLYRPADLQAWWLAADLGRGVYQLLARGIAPLAVGALAFELALPSDPLRWFAFALSVVLGVAVSSALYYLVGLAAFWLLDGSGLNLVSSLLAMFCSGKLLPLTVFPGLLGEIVQRLPWASMLQVPTDILLGRHTGAGLAGALAFQAGWVAVLLAAGRGLQSLATTRVVVQGG